MLQKPRESALPRIYTGTIIASFLGLQTGLTISQISASENAANANPSALRNLKL